MRLDLAIMNGTLVDEFGARPTDLGISDGRVVLLAERGTLPNAHETIDAGELLVLPGIIDAHYHIRAPDRPDREDVASGTAAAAAGGTTTLFEMPIADVGVDRAAVLLSRQNLFERDAHVDFGLFGAPGSLDATMIHGLAQAGAIGFKIFTLDPPRDRQEAFSGVNITSEAELLRALTLVRETGLTCAVHAENGELLQAHYQLARERGLSGADAFLSAHPQLVESLAVAWLAVLCEATGARVHIVHVTSAWAVDLIRTAQRRGAPLTAETCPQYLLFDEDDVRRYGWQAKVAPPMRSARDREALWQALADGTICLVASDHSPFLPNEKDLDDILAAPSGLPLGEALGPLMLSQALEGRIPLSRMVQLLTAEPARAYGLYPRKGCLLPGADADVLLYDPRLTTTIDIRRWHSHSRDSARLVDGRRLHGQVVQTLVRGRTVYRYGELVGPRGWGRMVRPLAQ